MKTAIILNTPDKIADVTENTVVCADGGYSRLKGIIPTAIIGDFDSLKDDNIRFPETTRIIKHPAEKNQTDGELALLYAINELHADEIVFYGALGGKIEHILGNLALLVIAKELGVSAYAKEPDRNIYLTDGEFALSSNVGDGVSIIPFGGNATVSDSAGLYYPLRNLELKIGSTRGISNVCTDTEFEIKITNGQALVFHVFK